MLIRTNGGVSGIKEYLEKGQKHDRYFSRDDLDERVILHGDLDAVDGLVTNLSNNGEKYFHITLSFKEDHIDNSILEKISSEFRDFYFKAFNDNEIMFYSEAHLPRIKTYQDKDGNLIERKPHIHIIVPKVNLITGELVDYRESENINYVNSFQEYINAKYGLESPKDNLRYKVNDNSEYIDRYKGDGFKGKGKDEKSQLLSYILENEIMGVEDLSKYLNQNGYKIKLRNSYKFPDKQYLNISKDDLSLNLRDHVFSQEFLSLSKKDKLEYLKLSAKNNTQKHYLIPGSARSVDEKHLEVLSEWNQVKSLELKFLKNHSRKQRDDYRNLTVEDKNKYLENLNKNHQIKILNNIKSEHKNAGNIKFRTREYSRVIALYLESTRSNLERFKDDVTRHCGVETENITGRWRNELKRRYTSNSQQSWGSERGYGANQNGGDSGDLNPQSSVIGSIDYQFNKLNFTELKQLADKFNNEIRADVLLEIFEKSHGVQPELYRITKAHSGADRIGAGNRNYSNLDFCLNEMHLSRKDALTYLNYALQMQREVDRQCGYSEADGNYLRGEYKKWFEEYKKERSKNLSQNRSDNKTRIDEIKLKFKVKIKEIRTDKSIFYHKKKDLVRATRFEQMAEMQAVYKAIKTADYDLRQKYNLEMQQSYRIFLMRKAQEKDERALRELRRLRINYTMSVDTLSISYVQRYEEYKLPITYEVDKNGVINYKINDTTVIKDHGVRVEVAKTKDEYIDLSLKLAMQKFGTKLSIRGKDEFRMQCVEHALKKGYKIDYLDDFSKEYHAKLMSGLQNKTDNLSKNSKAILADKPAKLIVENVTQAELLIHNKPQLVKVLTVKDLDSNKRYTLHSNKINFMAEKFDSGEFVTAVQDMSTGEVVIKRTPNAKIRALLIKENIENLTSQIYAENSEKKLHLGVLVKLGTTKNPWALIKNHDNTFVKVTNVAVFEKLKHVKIGSIVSIGVIGTRTETNYETKNEPLVHKLPSIVAEIEQYKKYPSTIIAELIKSSEFKLSDNSVGFRLVIKNIETGKNEVIFSNSKPAVKTGDCIQIDKKGWNDYVLVNVETIRDRVLNKYDSTDNITRGKILSSGFREIRGKPVYFVELQTTNGIVKKYGESIQKQIQAAKIKSGDWIEVQAEKHVIEKIRDIDEYSVTNVTQKAENLALEYLKTNTLQK